MEKLEFYVAGPVIHFTDDKIPSQIGASDAIVTIVRDVPIESRYFKLGTRIAIESPNDEVRLDIKIIRYGIASLSIEDCWQVNPEKPTEKIWFCPEAI